MDGARAATEWLQHHMHWNLIDGTTALRAFPCIVHQNAF